VVRWEYAIAMAGAVLGINPFDQPDVEAAAIQAFIDTESPDIDALQRVRMALRDKYRVATTVGIGPRYLHSTGQLHKGGAPSGVFLQIVGDDPVDVAIPGRSFGFSQLKQGQAAGDYLALKDKGRRVARVVGDELLSYAQ
jgi:transaldolase/glucose-6-phosphate isomerase